MWSGHGRFQFRTNENVLHILAFVRCDEARASSDRPNLTATTTTLGSAPGSVYWGSVAN